MCAYPQTAQIDHPDAHGRSPLRAAVQFGHYATAELLIDRAANVSLADERGCTPLHAAARFRHTSAARLLLERGAAVDAQDGDGMVCVCVYV